MASQLRRIHLYGALSKFSEEPFELAVHDMKDVLSALKSRFEGFRAFMHEHPNWAVVLTDEDKANPRPVYAEFAASPFSDCKEIHLVPDTQGAGLEAALIGWGFSAFAASIISTVVVNIAVAVVLGAVTQMLSPKIDNPIGTSGAGGGERPEQRPSFLYNGPENVIEQGYQVPVVYGTHMTGSVVVSAAITVEQLAVPVVQAATPTGTPPPAPPPAEDYQWSGVSDVGAGG